MHIHDSLSWVNGNFADVAQMNEHHYLTKILFTKPSNISRPSITCLEFAKKLWIWQIWVEYSYYVLWWMSYRATIAIEKAVRFSPVCNWKSCFSPMIRNGRLSQRTEISCSQSETLFRSIQSFKPYSTLYLRIINGTKISRIQMRRKQATIHTKEAW